MIRKQSNGEYVEYFDGLIDEVRIQSTARGVDWWKAQYLSMTDAFITFSDPSNDGTTGGGMSSGDLVTGQIAGGLDFDGTDDHVDLGNPSSFDFGTGNWTISGWFKGPLVPQRSIVANGGDDSGGIRWFLGVNDFSEMKLTCDDNSLKISTLGTTDVTDGSWHWGTAVRDGTTLRIYTDGTEENTNTCAAGYDLSGTSQRNAYIGAITNHSTGSLYKYMVGEIDEVRVASTARSADWIAAQYLSMTDKFIRWGIKIILWQEVDPY